jgi:hypothetical protein
MVAIHRRSLICPIGITVALADADDDDGTDQAYSYDISGALRCLVMQVDDGTDSAVGIDVVEISHDGGSEWYADGGTAKVGPGVLLCSADDETGTIAVAGVLNVSGAEPATARAGWFKVGPYEGPTLIRIGRDTSANSGTDWDAGQAPSVSLIPIGLPAGGGALTNEDA